MKYRVLFWHTCGSLPKQFSDMLTEDLVDVDGEVEIHKFIDFEKNQFPEVIKALNGLNMMVLNDVNTIFIDSRRFRQS